MKRLYVALVRQIRRPLRRVGILGWMERSPRRSVRWLRSLFSIYDFEDMVAIGDPWWTYAAIDEVDRFLRARPDARAFEYGSGASTLWLAQRCASVVSVEHDADFGRMVGAVVPDNVRLELVGCTPSDAPVVASGRAGYERCDFAEYVGVIDRVEGPFDLVVIDGRARSHCLERSAVHLAEGGIVVFDNARRTRYRAAIVTCGLDERRERGLAPGLPYPSCTTLLVNGPSPSTRP